VLQNVTITPARRSLEFGIYRDGDNNLDAIQESTLSQALRASAGDSRIEFTVEDTTALRAPVGPRQGQDDKEGLRTYDYTISDGDVGNVRSDKAADMSDEANLARFVARTLDNAQASGAKQTWIDLVDHGGGDGGGLQTRDGSVMSMPDIAKAISDGLAMHAGAHPTMPGARSTASSQTNASWTRWASRRDSTQGAATSGNRVACLVAPGQGFELYDSLGIVTSNPGKKTVIGLLLTAGSFKTARTCAAISERYVSIRGVNV